MMKYLYMLQVQCKLDGGVLYLMNLVLEMIDFKSDNSAINMLFDGGNNDTHVADHGFNIKVLQQ